jgi:hypothetical protein
MMCEIRGWELNQSRPLVALFSLSIRCTETVDEGWAGVRGECFVVFLETGETVWRVDVGTTIVNLFQCQWPCAAKWADDCFDYTISVNISSGGK